MFVGHRKFQKKIGISFRISKENETRLSAVIASSALWHLSAAELKTFTGHTETIYSAAVSGDNLFTGSYDKTAKQWNITSGQLAQTFNNTNGISVWAVAVKDDNLFAGAGFNIYHYNITSGQLIRTLSGYNDLVACLTISGNFLISGSFSLDKAARIWHIGNGTATGVVLSHDDKVNAIVVSGDHIFTASDDKTIKKWTFSGTLVKTLTGHTGAVKSLAVSGEYLLSGSADDTIRKWQISTGDYVETVATGQIGLYSLAVSGDYLFFDYTSTIKQLRLSTKTIMRELTGHSNAIYSIIVSGDYIYSASADKTAKQWCGATYYQSDSTCLPCANGDCSSSPSPAVSLTVSVKGLLLAAGVAIISLW